jgi:aminomethyltransferase
MNDTLRRVPLDALHRELGAKMGGFAGWDMPIQYPAGLKAEHQQTRTRAGLFDVSHMGQLRVRPKDGRRDTLHAQLEAALPVDFEGWAEGLQKYSYLLNDAGGIEDDLMLVNLGDEVRVVVNAGNRDHDLALLEARCPDLAFEWIDAALLALQGPQAEHVLARLDPAAAPMLFMQSRTLRLLGAECFTTRSGYTGEDGYEISVPSAAADAVARRLLADPDVAPVGLGARDTLRLEAGLPLHGNDISPSTTPVEAALAFAIPKSRRAGGLKAGGFPGAATVLRQLADGAPRKLVGLVSYDPVPIRAHAKLVDKQGHEVGEVTSGTVSPTLARPVMLAYVTAATVRDQGLGELHAVVRDKRPSVHITPLPFVAKRYKR